MALTGGKAGQDWQQQLEDALRVARMYYHQDMTTDAIGRLLGISRPKVSRLLSWAKSNGLVEFRVLDHREHQLRLEGLLEQEFGVPEAKVVPVHPDSTDAERTSMVTSYAAHYLNTLMRSGTTVGLAWGNTISALAERLIPKPLPAIRIAQMNGSGNSGIGITYAADLVMKFARNFKGTAYLLPMPAYFDDPRTKEAVFQERSIRRVREMALTADVSVYSIGVPDARSYVYQAGYIEKDELDALGAQGAVGDIATMFFREDGSTEGLEINERSSGPMLARLADATHAICIVAGTRKRRGILGALRGGYMKTLVIDEATARSLLE